MTSIPTTTKQVSDLERGDLLVCGVKCREVLESRPALSKGLQLVRVGDKTIPYRMLTLTSDMTVLVLDGSGEACK